MQVHLVQTEEVIRHELDPQRGWIGRREKALKASSAHRISHKGETYEAVNGTFDLPEEVAVFFLAQPGWFKGPNPFPPESEPAATRPATRPVSKPRRAAAA